MGKRNDATGHLRGAGEYSKSHPKLTAPQMKDRKAERASMVERMSGHGKAKKVSDSDGDYD
jgi:hypothetical protein